MAKLVQLVIVVAGVYLMWAYGIPWARSQVGESQAPTSNPAPGPGGQCVQVTAQASQALRDKILDGTRGLMEGAQWQGEIQYVEYRLADAHDACRCRLESCADGRAAISALRGILETVAIKAPSTQSGSFNAKRAQEQINQQLVLARERAVAGE